MAVDVNVIERDLSFDCAQDLLLLSIAQRRCGVSGQDPHILIAEVLSQISAGVDDRVTCVVSRDDLVISVGHFQVTFIFARVFNNSVDLAAGPLLLLITPDAVEDSNVLAVLSQRVVGSDADSLLVPTACIADKLIPNAKVVVQTEVLNNLGLLAAAILDSGCCHTS